MSINKLGVMATLMLLTGCASIVSGVHQSVSVETPPKKEATCSLENDKGKWFINKTPGSVTVHRSFDPLKIECHQKNPAGHYSGKTSADSHVKPIAFGNIIFGGIIGAIIDVIDGAAYDYPNKTSITLEKGTQAPTRRQQL